MTSLIPLLAGKSDASLTPGEQRVAGGDETKHIWSCLKLINLIMMQSSAFTYYSPLTLQDGFQTFKEQTLSSTEIA